MIPWFFSPLTNHWDDVRAEDDWDSLSDYKICENNKSPGDPKKNQNTRWFKPCPFHPLSLEVTNNPLKGSRELTIPKRSRLESPKYRFIHPFSWTVGFSVTKSEVRWPVAFAMQQSLVPSASSSGSSLVRSIWRGIFFQDSKKLRTEVRIKG